MMKIMNQNQGELRMDNPSNQYAGLMAKMDVHGEDSLTQEEWDFLQAYQPADESQEGAHQQNLAELIPEAELSRIGQKVLFWVEQDKESRTEWFEQQAKGIRALGVSPNVDGGAGFEGASDVVHPLLSEAVVQFASRTLGSLWPSGGPAKVVVLGSQSQERLEQASRVEQFVNYQYEELIPGAFEQTDRMLHRLPLSGSCFIKTYHDQEYGVCRRLVNPGNFIVPFDASDLRTAPRYTEEIQLSRNDIKKRQVQGLYRNIQLPLVGRGDDEEDRVVKDEIDAAEGRSDPSVLLEDIPHSVFECYCEYDLPGYEDQDGIALPYIITVDKTRGDVLSIYRNWDETDPSRRKRIYHVHYIFTPGFGFYGYGFYHWIGGLSKAATGALRALLDAAQFSNLQGGFRTRDAKIPGGDVVIAPGEWPEVDCSQEDLQKAFFRIPYGEPSRVLFELLPHLEGLARRFAGTTEAAIGEGQANVPVGTTLARIEQAGKVLTAIQYRLHHAQKEEFKIVSWLNSKFLPQEYPYAIGKLDRKVFRSDFDSRVDVVTVSDPNYVSNTQRYFIAQAAVELADRAPNLYNLRALHKRVLASLRIEDIDEILPDDKIKRLDPVSENALMMTGKPVEAQLEQNHQAHIQVHASLLNDPTQAKRIGGVVDAHIQEHLAQAYLLQMQQLIGFPIKMEELPPEMETQIAIAAAMASPSQPPQPEADPELMKAQADISRKDQQALSDMRRKDAVVAADIERKQTAMLLEQQNKFPQPPRFI